MLTLEQYVADLLDGTPLRCNQLLSKAAEEFPEASIETIREAIKAARRREC